MTNIVKINNSIPAPMFRKGDIVSVTGAVKYDCGSDEKFVAIEMVGSPATYIKREDLKIVQHDIAVDDRVAFEGGAGLVIAVANSHAWLLLDDGNYCTRMVNGLFRVEA